MKGIFITINDLSSPSDGVAKKSIDQIEALREVSGEISYFYLEKDVLVFVRSTGDILRKKLAHKYLFLYWVANIVRSLSGVDFAYIRNPHGGLHAVWLFYLCFWIKTSCKNIILDVPHFPYDKEESSLFRKLSGLIHRLNRPFLKRVVSAIVYTGAARKKIWGVNCFRLKNSVDISRIKSYQASYKMGDALSFVGVANVAPWHGYDRLIRGIHEYYNCNAIGRDVNFLVVGAGEPTISKLKEISNKLGVSERIKFLGPLSGTQLDAIFDSAHIGVDALGRHRSGNNYNDSIKSKEYTARGIPFIKSHDDDSFDNSEFVLTVSSGESAIDIESIIDWFDNLSVTPAEIRHFARNNFTWKQQYKYLFIELGLTDGN